MLLQPPFKKQKKKDQEKKSEAVVSLADTRETNNAVAAVAAEACDWRFQIERS